MKLQLIQTYVLLQHSGKNLSLATSFLLLSKLIRHTSNFVELFFTFLVEVLHVFLFFFFFFFPFSLLNSTICGGFAALFSPLLLKS